MERRWLDIAGYIVTGLSTLFCFLLFYYDTLELWKSLAAAFMTGGLVLASYIILRWLILAARP